MLLVQLRIAEFNFKISLPMEYPEEVIKTCEFLIHIAKETIENNELRQKLKDKNENK
jgi:hypothetical protein